MQRLRILFLTQVLPYPLVGGAKIRAYYMLRYLSQQHEVTLLSFTRVDDRPEDVQHLSVLCSSVHTVPMSRSRAKDAYSLVQSVLHHEPLVIARDRLASMEGAVTKLLQEGPFDMVHADQTSMAYYALFARSAQIQAGYHAPRLLLDEHNALYLVVQRQAAHERGWFKRLLWRREAALLAGYEASLCQAFDHLLTVTQEDREALLRLLPVKEAPATQNKFTVLPICVDPAGTPLVERELGSATILHLGTMFWPPNVEGVLWFANEVLPHIVAAVPECQFVVAGKNPPPAVWALAEAGFPLARHIQVTGYVADPWPLLAYSRMIVVPLLAGGGMRVKILDAWLWGLPVVSTTIGAEGIQMRPGDNILLADDPASFAGHVVRLLQDSALADRLRRNGRHWVEQQYDWRRVYQKLDRILEFKDRSVVPLQPLEAPEQV